MNRAIDLQQGVAYVVSDLHGNRDAYSRYRDHFLTLHDRGQADRLVFLGDVIHSYGPPEEDASLRMILDIMQLRDELGPDVVIMLLGNHELPHIYGLAITKGELTFTPRFEHALGRHRSRVIDFFKSLPFMVRTAGGVLLTHAGASVTTATPDAAQLLLNFSHDALLARADQLLARHTADEWLAAYQQSFAENYEQSAREYLAVSGPDDPRYLDLLRSSIITALEPEWPLLWGFFFTRCEAESPGTLMYGRILERFLQVYSPPDMPQRVMVSGHIVAKDGYTIIADRQLRLASWTHARPETTGKYLLFDVARPVQTAADLEPFVFPMP